jgi:hydrogenase maturation protein HypF
MLPYTPLHYLLFSAATPPLPPLVMTSGNLSEEPIATDNQDARERLRGLADAFLMHDRPIRTRCDDSLVREWRGRAYFLRRSRGYAPDPIRMPIELPSLLAVGPELKNTFCLTRGRYAFLSQHIGDMENYETLSSFEDGVEHLERLFRIRPEALVHDLHPDYLSTQYAQRRAARSGLPVFGVQHHHAHIAACMADNGLSGREPVIGLAFDGTGFGTDGAIWGGEFLLADYRTFERKFHFAYFPLPGGDAAIQRPARTALALLWSLGLEWEPSLAPVRGLVQEELQALHQQLERRLNAPMTSSLGRLFDAAAALAGLRQQVNYEAQAAMEFEALLEDSESSAYPFELGEAVIDPGPAFRALLADMRAGITVSRISARFHNGLAQVVRSACDVLRAQSGIRAVALSGGVWQNMALLERSQRALLADGFQVYLHQQVPTNDGGLSLGQALIGAARLGSAVKT